MPNDDLSGLYQCSGCSCEWPEETDSTWMAEYRALYADLGLFCHLDEKGNVVFVDPDASCPPSSFWQNLWRRVTTAASLFRGGPS